MMQILALGGLCFGLPASAQALPAHADKVVVAAQGKTLGSERLMAASTEALVGGTPSSLAPGSLAAAEISGLASPAQAPAADAKPNAKPNIVIIYADDMGYGDTSCNNPESKIPTPNIDALAKEGMRFTDGHCSSAICTPSRYALLTGNYHWRKNIFSLIYDDKGPQNVFHENQATLPRILHNNGYNAGMIGKWHLGWRWESIVKDGDTLRRMKAPSGEGDSGEEDASGKPSKGVIREGYDPSCLDWSKRFRGGPIDIGFDSYFGDDTINFAPYGWIKDDKAVEPLTEFLRVPTPRPLEGSWECRGGPMVKGWDFYQVFPTLEKKAVEFIEQAPSDKPFFLYYALPAPHAPIIPNQEFIGKTKIGPYGDSMVQVDATVGAIRAALKKKGIYENTIIIFTSDNGPTSGHRGEGENRHSCTGFEGQGSLTGKKRNIEEGGHRMPFIVTWPGVTKPGSVSHQLINQVDLHATLSSIVGAKMPTNTAIDSFDFSPILRGQDAPVRDHMILNTTSPIEFGLREGSWVLIACLDQDRKQLDPKKGYLALYDLSKTLEQNNRTNLAKANPEKAQAMLKTLIQKVNSPATSPRLSTAAQIISL
jgi:arylsulfatase A